MRGSRGVVLAVVAVVLLAVGATVGLLSAGGALEAGPHASSAPTPPPTTGPAPVPDPVLEPVEGTPPTAAGLDRTLTPLLGQPALGSSVSAVVVDAITGDRLWERGGERVVVPASSVKVLTAAAVLASAGPAERFVTRTVRGAPDEVVLVGGGDPMLTASTAAPDPLDYPTPTRLSDLAAATAAALRAEGVSTVRLAVDDSLYAGPAVSPAWQESYLPNGNVLPISALTVEAAVLRPEGPQRGVDQALWAGDAFARLLADNGLAVSGPVERRAAPAGAPVLRAVESVPMRAVVERMLSTSDNDMAEQLARRVALAEGVESSFAGAATATEQVLDRLGVDVSGLVLQDGSGLSRANLASPRTLAGTLAVAARPDRTALRPVLSGLPIAGLTGTLALRFGGAEEDAGFGETGESAAGLVRGKTGTLSGVSSLTGTAYDTDGRLLAFSVVADQVPPDGTLEAQDALDTVAAALAACGCR